MNWFDERFYEVDGVYLPSVTTILGRFVEPYLLTWYGDNGTERARWKSRNAKLRGSNVHNAIYELHNGNVISLLNYSQEEWLQIYRYIDFFKALPGEELGVELTIYNKQLGYAGTLDRVIKIAGGEYNLGKTKKEALDGGVYVIDYKTGNESYKYFAQLGAYAQAYELMNDCNVAGTMLLYLDAQTKSGWKAVVRNRERWLKDFEVFKSYLFIYQDDGEDKPKIFELPDSLSLEGL